MRLCVELTERALAILLAGHQRFYAPYGWHCLGIEAGYSVGGLYYGVSKQCHA